MRPPEGRSRRIVAATYALIAACYVTLVAIVLTSPKHPVYDEGWYLDTTALLAKHGLSKAFLLELPGPAGPTFTFVYAAVEQLAGTGLPWLRFVGLAFLFACSVLIASTVVASGLGPRRSGGTAHSWLAGAMFIMLPTVATSAGMTLTEIPAMTFALVATLVLVRNDRDGVSIAACVLAGLALGIAILGRQNYLIILPCLALLIDWNRFRETFPRLFLIGFVAVAVCGPVFLIWKGLVPPLKTDVGASFRPWFVFLSAGYLGLISLLIEPRIYSPFLTVRALVGLAAAAAALVAAIGEPLTPARTLLSFLGPAELQFVGWIWPSLLGFLAVAFLTMMTYRLFEERADRSAVFIGAIVLFGTLSNINNVQFSSRYIFVVLPFLLVFLAPSTTVSRELPARLALGAAIGLASLASYFR